MMKPNDGGPAFPVEYQTGQMLNCGENRYIPQTKTRPGMSLRAWFAGMAIQGLFSNGSIRLKPAEPGSTSRDPTVAKLVVGSFAIADAMIAELESCGSSG